MSSKSNIEWTNTTWNPMVGCTKVSAGCANCYAIKESRRVLLRVSASAKLPRGLATRDAYAKAVTNDSKPPRWTGKIGLMEHKLRDPLNWQEPRMVFVNSMSDLFHEDVPFEFIDKVFAMMALTPQHTYQVLTKRPERMAEYMNQPLLGFRCDKDFHFLEGRLDGSPLSNVWLGTSVEDQKTADERIPHLIDCPAAVRWLSCEPLLGDVELDLHEGDWHCPECGQPGCDNDVCFENDLSTWGCTACGEQGLPGEDATWKPSINWLVVGGESGKGARPLNVQWVRDIRDQCKHAGVPVFVKQLGANIECIDAIDAADHFPKDVRLSKGTIHSHARVHLVNNKGSDWSEWPEDLRVREYPEAQA